MPTHYPITRQAYNDIPGINHSLLKHIERSPAHLMHARRSPRKATPAMIEGLLLDHLVFGTEFVFEVSPFKDFKTDAAKAWRDEKTQAGVEIVTRDQYEYVRAMLASVQASGAASGVLASGFAQVGITGEISGVAAKALPDWMPAKSCVIWDLKTTTDASMDAFRWKIRDMDYDSQAAFYVELARQASGEEWFFGWIVVETDPPHGVALYLAEPRTLDEGRRKVDRWITRFAECLERDAWPAYPDTIQTISVPYRSSESSVSA